MKLTSSSLTSFVAWRGAGRRHRHHAQQGGQHEVLHGRVLTGLDCSSAEWAVAFQTSVERDTDSGGNVGGVTCGRAVRGAQVHTKKKTFRRGAAFSRMVTII